MKKLLIGLAALVVIAVAGLVAAPFFIPVETYKEQIAQAALDATGRELSIKGDFQLSLLPRLELEADDVSFANAPGASEPQMAALQKLRVQLQVLPLLSGQVKVDSFVLVDPVIHLSVDKKGRANWDFSKATGGTSSSGTSSGGTAGEGMGGPGLQELSLGDVRLENGRVTYSDARSGQTIEISQINMTLSLPDLDSPVSADGSLTWNGEALKLSAKSGNLRGLMEGKTSALELALDSNPIKLGYKGQITKAKGGRADGDVDLDVPSIRALAAWTGNPIEAPGEGLGPLKIQGKIAATDKVFAFTGAKIALDSMNAEGDITADIGGAKPSIKGRLDLDQLDLNPYLPPQQEQKTASGSSSQGATTGTSGASGEQAKADWSDEPIDLAGLKAANVDFALSVGGILVQELKIGRSALTISLKDGLLLVDLSELNLYGGNGTGKIQIDGRGKVPAVRESFAIAGVQAEPFLTDAAGFKRLSGTGQFDISVATQGRTQREMVQALGGKGAVKFTDGAVKGMNLAAMVRNVGSAFLDSGSSKAQQTDFAELSGTFLITKGNLRNDDLLLLNPLLRLSGAGNADMPPRTVNYRVEPKVVASTEGQGGATEAAGLTVPVIIEGPWDNIKYRPDLASMIGNIAKDPEKALEGAKGVLEGLTKQPADGDSTGGILKDPGSTLKKLFGN